MRKPCVWGDEDVRSLIASVAKGFPVGALLTLETGGEVEFKPRVLEGVQNSVAKPAELLLDGQQRMTSLYQAAYAKAPVRTKTLVVMLHDGRTREVIWMGVSTTSAIDSELRAHAEFPKGDVDIKHRTISVPLGTLECTVYKVTGQNGAVTTFYFADTLPGPPVFFYVEVGGKRVRTQTMDGWQAGIVHSFVARRPA